MNETYEIQPQDVLRLIAARDGVREDGLMGAFRHRRAIEIAESLRAEEKLIKIPDGRYKLKQKGRVALLMSPRNKEEQAVLDALSDQKPHTVAFLENNTRLMGVQIRRTLSTLFEIGLVGTVVGQQGLSGHLYWLRTYPQEDPSPGVTKITLALA